MGSSEDDAAGSAQQMSDITPAMSAADSPEAAKICRTLIPSCLTSTPAESSRFIDTYVMQEGSSPMRKAPASSGADRHVSVSTTIMKGTTATLAASSPPFPRRRTSTPTRQVSAPYGRAAPNMSRPVASMPAIMADSTMSALKSIIASTAGRALPNIAACAPDMESVSSLRPTSSSTAVNANISPPHASGTNSDGFQPKNAAIS